MADAYDQVGVGWESQFVFMEPHGLGPIKGLIAGGPGFVMWSDEADGRPGFLLGSAGGDWGQVDASLTGRTMLALAADGSGLVGLASHGQGAIERWRSADGTIWDQTATSGIDGTPSVLVMTSAGFIAAGVDRSGCGLATWTSRDAVSWTVAGPLPGGPSTCASSQNRPTVDQLLAGGDGLIALGHLPGPETVVWASLVGQIWHRLPDPASGGIEGIAAVGTGYVAVGHDGRTPVGAAAWISKDGTSWTAAPAQASFAGASMTAVVALADGSLASVGRESGAGVGSRFVAWTSIDGQTWQRSPDPLCQNVGVCDAGGSLRLLLAGSGGHLVAYDGSINILSSPPLTAGLRPGTLELSFVDAPAGTWTSGSVAGYCAPASDASGAVAFGGGYPRLADIGAASGSGSYVPSLQLVLGPDASVRVLVYDRGDDAGFTEDATSLGPGASASGPDHVTVDAGSTPQHGRLEFRDMPVTRLDSTLPPVSPVSGWLNWSCG